MSTRARLLPGTVDDGRIQRLSDRGDASSGGAASGRGSRAEPPASSTTRTPEPLARPPSRIAPAADRRRPDRSPAGRRASAVDDADRTSRDPPSDGRSTAPTPEPRARRARAGPERRRAGSVATEPAPSRSPTRSRGAEPAVGTGARAGRRSRRAGARARARGRRAEPAVRAPSRADGGPRRPPSRTATADEPRRRSSSPGSSPSPTRRAAWARPPPR